MPLRTTLTLIVTLLVILAGAFVYTRSENTARQTIITAPVTTAATTSSTGSINSLQASSSQATATIIVAEKSYSVVVIQGETVLNAMRALTTAGTLVFTGRDYSGLGFFIDSINGVQNADGKYWVFYVNGVSATIGASAQIINAGDIIEWRYEKGY